MMGQYSHLLIPITRSQRVSSQGIKSLLTWLQFSGYADLHASEESEGWVTHHLSPGPYAHNLFIEGEAAHLSPAFSTMLLSTGETLKELLWGAEALSSMVSIELRSSPYPTLLERLPDQLISIMALKCERFCQSEA